MAEKDKIAENMEKTVQFSEIVLAIDTYDDIFSDFDARPYSSRAISQDFLEETERASRDKIYEELELKFIIPKHQRNINQETIIKKRLNSHFKKHRDMKKKEIKKIYGWGLFRIFAGIFLMFIATYLLFKEQKSFLINFLVVLLEPSGWFFFWTGLDKTIDLSKQTLPEKKFYEKMVKSKISFHDS